MAISTVAMEEALFSGLKRQGLAALHMITLDAYLSADAERRQHHDHPEGGDIVGDLRRAHLERGLRGVADRFRHVRATVEQNAARNTHYMKLRAGRITLTASATEGPNVAPRDAIFRTSYAQNNQMDMYRPNDSPDELYAILFHVSRGPTIAEPAYVRIGFPHPTRSKRFIHVVDLGRMFGTGIGEPKPGVVAPGDAASDE